MYKTIYQSKKIKGYCYRIRFDPEDLEVIGEVYKKSKIMPQFLFNFLESHESRISCSKREDSPEIRIGKMKANLEKKIVEIYDIRRRFLDIGQKIRDVAKEEHFKLWRR